MKSIKDSDPYKEALEAIRSSCDEFSDHEKAMRYKALIVRLLTAIDAKEAGAEKVDDLQDDIDRLNETITKLRVESRDLRGHLHAVIVNFFGRHPRSTLDRLSRAWDAATGDAN